MAALLLLLATALTGCSDAGSSTRVIAGTDDGANASGDRRSAGVDSEAGPAVSTTARRRSP